MHIVAHHGSVHDATVVDRSSERDVDRSRTERWPSSRGWLSRQYHNCVRRDIQGVSNRSASTAGTGKKTVEANITGCQPFDAPPTLTVTNGLAQFQAMGVTFAGYVTPQGHLTMHSGYGATATGQARPALVDEDFDGNFETQTHVLHARVSSVNCTYDVNWQRIT